MSASVCILESSYIVYEGLKHILLDLSDFKVEPVFPSFSHLESHLRARKCDLLFCNSSLVPNRQAITNLKARNPGLRVLVIDHGKSEYHTYMNATAIEGYISLYCHMKEVVGAFTALSHGKKFFCESAGLMVPARQQASKSAFLSEREAQILKLIANGFSSKEISKELFVSFHTITTHRKNICKKLKVNKVSDVIAKAYKLNLV